MPNGSDVRDLRILMTTDAVGGVCNYALHLARELCRRGATITLACMGPAPSADQRREMERVPGLELRHAAFALEWADDPWEDVERAGEWLVGLAREFRPDVVHVNGFAHASLPWPAPALLVAHSCVLSWWRAVHGQDAPPRYATYRARVARGLNAARVVIAPSASMLDTLRSFYSYRGAGLVIANGVPLDNYFPRPKQPFYLAAGRVWDEAKNIALIAKAAPALPWPVTLVGDGSLPLREGPVQHLGRLSSVKLAQLMSEASLFIHPARYEPFGLAPLEAALSGAALVLGRIDSLREIWGSAALYVATDDPGELIHCATRLADDAIHRHELARLAQARARDFSVELMTDRYSAVYRSLLAGPRHVSDAECSHGLQVGP